MAVRTGADRALNAKQERFVAEYLIDLNATQAAIRAGYSERTAGRIAGQLLALPHVSAAVAARQREIANKLGITQERVLTELAKIGFSDIRKAIKWNGHYVREEDNPDGGDILVIKETRTNLVALVDSEELDDDTAAAIAEVSQNATGGVKIKLHDKRAALVDIGKHLGMFRERVELTGKDGGPVEVSTFHSNRERARAALHVIAKAKAGK